MSKSSSKFFDQLQKIEPELTGTIRAQLFPEVGSTKTIISREKSREIPLTLTSKSYFHRAIFQAISTSTQTDWFKELGDIAQINYLHLLRHLLKWLNEEDACRTEEHKYECLNDFHIFRLNVSCVKHSGVPRIKLAISKGIESKYLTNEDKFFLETLMRVTKKVIIPAAHSITLTGWFSLPWLRSVVGEASYLQLESPKRLMLSFRTTIAMTLLFLLEARKQWRERSKKEETKNSNREWSLSYSQNLLGNVARFNEEGLPSDGVSVAIWLDGIFCDLRNPLSKTIKQQGQHNLPKMVKLGEKYRKIWRQPVLFRPENLHNYSPLEERLIAWLSACEAIQPTDILKLKSSDYAMEFNSSGRLLMIQSQYFKGRAGSLKQPAILMGSHCWTKALFQYLQGLSAEKLIRKWSSPQKLNSPFPRLGLASTQNNEVNYLIRLWKSPILYSQILAELRKVGSSPIFLSAMFALDQGAESVGAFVSRTGTSAENYRRNVERHTPASIFSLTQIKTTAVHAGSDRYRDSDLINHHSHSSKTERHSYLTDDNKEWVNQCGRITRLVLHDLQNVVFQPSIDRMQISIKDVVLRTKIIDATGTEDVEIVSQSNLMSSPLQFRNEIIVSDTPETALYFIHYLSQAGFASQRLLSTRPDFVERTLLVQIEWMTQILKRMRNTKSAHKTYQKIRADLPPLFEHLMETIE